MNRPYILRGPMSLADVLQEVYGWEVAAENEEGVLALFAGAVRDPLIDGEPEVWRDCASMGAVIPAGSVILLPLESQMYLQPPSVLPILCYYSEPTSFSEARTELNSQGVTQLSQMWRMRPDEFADPTYSRVCRMMALNGLDPDTAYGLVSRGVSSIEVVNGLSALVFKEHLLEAAPPVLRSWFEGEEAWVGLKQQVGRLVSEHVDAFSELVLPLGAPTGLLRRVRRKWRRFGRSTRRTAQERLSASAIASALDLQASYQSLALRLREEDWRGLADGIDAFYDELSGWSGVEGPSVGDVIEHVGAELRRITDEDFEEAIVDLEGDFGSVVQAFRVEDLEGAGGFSLDAASPVKVRDLGRKGRARVRLQFSEADAVDLQGIDSHIAPVLGGARWVDRIPQDSFQAEQALSTLPLGSLLADVFQPLDLPPLLLEEDDPEEPEMTLSRRAVLRVPDGDELLGFMDHLRDRFVVFQPSRSSEFLRSSIPLNSHFKTRYIDQVLDRFAGHYSTQILATKNFRDPGRFLLCVPLLVGALLPQIQAIAFEHLGAPYRSRAVLRGAQRPFAIEIGELLPPPEFHVDAYQEAELSAGVPVVELEDRASGRNFEPSLSAPVVSSEEYLYPQASGGRRRLPVATSANNLRYRSDSGSLGSIQNHTFIDWAPHDVALGAAPRPFGMAALATNGVVTAALRVHGNGLRVRVGEAIDLELPVPVVLPDSRSPDAWIIKACRRRAVAGVVAWRVVVVADLDDGAGPVLLSDQYWTETETSALSDLDEWGGVMLGSGSKDNQKEMGGGAFWNVALANSVMDQAILAAARTYDAAPAVARLLGRAPLDVDTPLELRVAEGSIFAEMEGETDLLKALIATNQRADNLYVGDIYDEAESQYERVLRLASYQPALSEFMSKLEAGGELVRSVLEQGGSSVPSLGQLRYLGDDGVDEELYAGAEQASSSLLRTKAARAFRLEEASYASDKGDFTAVGQEGEHGSYRGVTNGSEFTLPSDFFSQSPPSGELIPLWLLPRQKPPKKPDPVEIGGDPSSPPAPPLDPSRSFDHVRGRVEVLHAVRRLQALRAGFNFLGLDPAFVPSWPYQALRQQAMRLVAKAEELQSRSFSLQQEAQREMDLLADAVEALDLARDELRTAHAGVDVVSGELAEARLQKEAAQRRKKLFNGPAGSAWLGTIGALAAGVAFVASTVATGGATLAVAAVATSAAAGTLSQGFAAVSTQLRVKGDADLAEQMVREREEALERANLDLELARLVANNAQVLVDALQSEESNFLDDEAYAELKWVTDAIATAMLERANRLAWLAERALLRETACYGNIIQTRYGTRYSALDRYTSAVALRSDLEKVETTRLLSTALPWQPVRTTVSLLTDVEPSALIQLRSSGEALIRIDRDLIDRRFPGTYLRRLQHVEIDIVGLGGQGRVRGVLRMSASGTTRVPNTPPYVDSPALVGHDPFYPEGEYTLVDVEGYTKAPYVAQPMIARPATLLLSEYVRRTDGAILSPPDGSLDSVSSQSTDILWLLELTSQDLDLTAIQDVRVTLYFTALYDRALHARQDAVWASENTLSSMVVFASQADFDRLQEARIANEPSSPGDRSVLRLPFDGRMAPQWKERELANLAIALGKGGAGLSVRIAHRLAPFGVVVTTDEKGEAFSAVGDRDVLADLGDGPELLHTSREGTFVTLDNMVRAIQGLAEADSALGFLTVKILAAANPEFKKRGFDGSPVLKSVRSYDLTGFRTLASFSNVEVEVLVHSTSSATVSLWVGDPAQGMSAEYADVDLGAPSHEITQDVTSVTVGTSVHLRDGGVEEGYWLGVRVEGREATFSFDRQPLEVIDLGTAGPRRIGMSTTATAGVVLRHFRYRTLGSDGRPTDWVLLDLEDAAEVDTPQAATTVDVPILDLDAISDVVGMFSCTHKPRPL